MLRLREGGVADFFDDLSGEEWHALPKADEGIFDLDGIFRSDLGQLRHHHRRVHRVQGEKVVLRMPDFNVQWCYGRLGKMAEIEGHDQRDARFEGCRQDVSVLRVVGHEWLQALVSADQRFRKMAGYLLAEGVRQFDRPPELGGLCAADFVEDGVRPFWQLETRRLGQPQQQVAHAEVGEHASIEQHREISLHPRPYNRRRKPLRPSLFAAADPLRFGVLRPGQRHSLGDP